MPFSDLRQRLSGWRVALATLVAAFTFAAPAAAAVKVITSTEDLAAIVGEVGGDRVDVESLARGYQDPHLVEPKPSFILKLHSADLLVVVGRELEVGWLPRLVQQSRNSRIQPGGSGYLDASLNARILDIPTGEVSRAMGDVHPLGNPHYWLDPDNGRRIAQAVRDRLSQISPGDAQEFARRYADFDRRLAEAEKRWDGLMAPYRGVEIVTYHRSWSNLAERFGLKVIGYVEPKPGIPPSPAHTLALTQEMKQRGVRLIIVEPYFDVRTPNSIARASGARVLVLTPSVGGVKEAGTYIALFDYNLRLLASALQPAGAR